MITEDTTATFILDKMFHINDTNLDRECPTMAQSLISAISSSDVTAAQETVVQEVKLALQRALNEPETNEKHSHIEGLATLIPAMIENNGGNGDNNSQFFKTNNHSQLRHKIFYIMLDKGIITDIARAVQYLELGGPNTTATINHLLKPLEMLLRLTNEPMLSMPLKYKKLATTRRSTTAVSDENNTAVVESVNQDDNQNVQTTSEAVNPPTTDNQTATNSDSTNAQDEQMLADDSEQNTDRDMSSAAIDSLVG
jgi:hypothetical protein